MAPEGTIQEPHTLNFNTLLKLHSMPNASYVKND